MPAMKIELEPWQTPNYVIGKLLQRQVDAAQEAPKWPLSDVDAQTLAGQCDRFRAEIFRKAGKEDPAGKAGIRGG